MKTTDEIKARFMYCKKINPAEAAFYLCCLTWQDMVDLKEVPAENLTEEEQECKDTWTEKTLSVPEITQNLLAAGMQSLLAAVATKELSLVTNGLNMLRAGLWLDGQHKFLNENDQLYVVPKDYGGKLLDKIQELYVGK